MDAVDREIIGHLMRDGRATFAEIGAGVGLSAPAVKRRVDRMRASGQITGFTALIDPAALGWTTEAYVEIYYDGNVSAAEQVVERMREHARVERTRSAIVMSRLFERPRSR